MLVARCASGVIWIQGHRPRYARPPRMPHSLPRASCANPFTHVLAQASLDSSVRKSLLRREGDSNPRNPFGVYTLSRRASSTTRASLLRRNWLARRNSQGEFGLPPLLLLNRTHEVRFIFYSVHDRHKFSMNIFGIGAEAFSFARRHNTPNDPQRYKIIYKVQNLQCTIFVFFVILPNFSQFYNKKCFRIGCCHLIYVLRRAVIELSQTFCYMAHPLALIALSTMWYRSHVWCICF